MKKERNYNLMLNILFGIFLFVFVNLILNLLIFPVRQNSISMNPDITEKTSVLVTPLAKNYERGDIVLVGSKKEDAVTKMGFLSNVLASFFTGQQISLRESKNSPATKQHIRRVVGMPGDTIYMRDYVLYIKPEGEKHFLTEFEISPKNYNVSFVMPPSGWDGTIGVSGMMEEQTLKDDEYFVLGDFRLSCDDSRVWGILNSSDFDGKVLMSYFPFSKIKFF